MIPLGCSQSSGFKTIMLIAYFFNVIFYVQVMLIPLLYRALLSHVFLCF